MVEKKKKLKREGKKTTVEEDDQEKYKHALYVMTMKLFADMERKRRNQDQRDMEDRKRKREDEIDAEEKAKAEKEWQKNYEVCELNYLYENIRLRYIIILCQMEWVPVPPSYFS